MNDFDRAQLRSPLAPDQGESSWLCTEAIGRGPDGQRHIAVLAWLHRTGPRLLRLDSGIGLLDHAQLPARWRDVIPSWLPILTPVTIRTDDRALLMVVAYDLDKPELPPIQIEQEIEHAEFDPETFSGVTADRTLALHVADQVIDLHVASDLLRCTIRATPTKAHVEFGGRSAWLRHKDIEVGYRQRSRVAVSGQLTLRHEPIHDLVGEGAHDRHWRESTTMNLSWLWLHLRLADKELVAYVIRDSRDPAAERGRGAWLVHENASAEPIADFELLAVGHRFEFSTSDLRCTFAHAVAQPYLRMRAFGDGIVGGIAEAPIKILDFEGEAPRGGWLEVFDATTCRPA